MSPAPETFGLPEPSASGLDQPRLPLQVPPIVVWRPTKPAPERVPSRPRPRLSAPSVADAKAYALNRVGSVQFGCLDRLFTRESGWNPSATNPTSGAYGIPQALPGSKMSTFGSDWRWNPVTQVKWGLSYIAGSYGTPCGAWSHSQTYGWY